MGLVGAGLAFLAAIFLLAAFFSFAFFEADFFALALGSTAATWGFCVAVGPAAVAFLEAVRLFAQCDFIAAAILARPAADILRRG